MDRAALPRSDPPRAGDTARSLAAHAEQLAGDAPPGDTEALDPDTRVRESLLLGMRTLEGTDLARVRAETGVDPRRGREAVLARQVAAGNVHDDGAVWRIPQDRWLLADDITARMF